MDILNLYDRLNQAGIDEKAGIKIDRVTGDDSFSLYIAEIFPGTWLKPHYHMRGIELYQILEGTGTMRMGRMDGDSVSWEESCEVRAGDCFTIPEGAVHQLGNMGINRLIACFTCPPSHLGDDRFFV